MHVSQQGVGRNGAKLAGLPESRRGIAYRSGFLIHCLCMSSVLARDSGLREAVTVALQLALPPGIRDPLVASVRSAHLFPLPSACTMSRWRLLLDAALMLHTRQNYSRTELARYLLVDASTQGFAKQLPNTMASSTAETPVWRRREGACEV